MTLSVLISVYKSENPERFNHSLQSIWTNQTYKPDYIVIIKDGTLSKELDNVIEQWSISLSNKLIIITNKENLGLTKSLNKGIDVIKTDLIARMDSDDISDPLRFERQVKFLENNPDIDVVGGKLQEFNDYNPNLNIRSYPTTSEDIKRYIVKASPIAHPTVMMRRRIFDTGIRYNEKYRTCQDLALWFELLHKGFKIANLSEVTIYFRRGDDLYKRRNRKRAWIELEIFIKGIYKLYGLFTLAYIYPISRFVFRLMPVSFIKKIYGSKMRKRILE